MVYDSRKRKHPRMQPYLEGGISRMGCFRCGAPARFQWQVCSDGRQYRPICRECDIALNLLVLEWMGFEPDQVADKMAAYALWVAKQG